MGSLFNKQNNMTTTEIIFDEKQEYETIKQIINSNFVNVKEYDSIGELQYVSFDFEGQTIDCYFIKDNKIYGKNNELTECSSFSSDRQNDIKTKAFRIIAKHFNCKFLENDCSENNVEVFKAKKILKIKKITGYNSKTQTDKNIAWFLPRPKPDHYKGGMPLYCEDWLVALAKDILNIKHDPFTLNVFCGMNKRGYRVDMKEEVNPDLLCDIHKLSEYLQPVGPRFDLIIADPPYSTDEAKDIYGTPPLKYKTWTSECDKYLKCGGLFMVYHKFVMPNPNPEKYEVVKRVFIGNRTMHLPRVCVVFRKRN